MKKGLNMKRHCDSVSCISHHVYSYFSRGYRSTTIRTNQNTRHSATISSRLDILLGGQTYSKIFKHTMETLYKGQPLCKGRCYLFGSPPLLPNEPLYKGHPSVEATLASLQGWPLTIVEGSTVFHNCYLLIKVPVRLIEVVVNVCFTCNADQGRLEIVLRGKCHNSENEEVTQTETG